LPNCSARTKIAHPGGRTIEVAEPEGTGVGDIVMFAMLSVTRAYVTSLGRALPVLLCPLLLAASAAGARRGSGRGAC
jgi:hypothetical protein